MSTGILSGFRNFSTPPASKLTPTKPAPKLVPTPPASKLTPTKPAPKLVPTPSASKLTPTPPASTSKPVPKASTSKLVPTVSQSKLAPTKASIGIDGAVAIIDKKIDQGVQAVKSAIDKTTYNGSGKKVVQDAIKGTIFDNKVSNKIINTVDKAIQVKSNFKAGFAKGVVDTVGVLAKTAVHISYPRRSGD